MAGPDDDAEKSHEPSEKKLLDARKKGEIARSVDVSTAAGYLGVLLACIAAGGASLSELGLGLSVLIDQSHNLAPLFFENVGQAPTGGIALLVIKGMAAFFLLPAIIVLLVILAQRAFLVTGSKLKPKISRISLISNAKNKFGRAGLFEFAKSFAKLVIYSVCLAIFLRVHFNDMAASVFAAPGGAVEFLGQLIVQFLFIVLVVSTSIAVVDYGFQRSEHLRKNRMSYKEMQDEHKESEGDPYLKQERRARAQQMASNQMMSDVPDADVIIVNPTHYAVALKWSRAPGAAPVCVAKGVDEIARRIREIGQEAGVPLHSDPPTARALHATVEIGDEISADHYGPVAAAIRFAEDMRKRARR